jgi:hypothetical protein
MEALNGRRADPDTREQSDSQSEFPVHVDPLSVG